MRPLAGQSSGVRPLEAAKPSTSSSDVTTSVPHPAAAAGGAPFSSHERSARAPDAKRKSPRLRHSPATATTPRLRQPEPDPTTPRRTSARAQQRANDGFAPQRPPSPLIDPAGAITASEYLTASREAFSYPVKRSSLPGNYRSPSHSQADIMSPHSPHRPASAYRVSKPAPRPVSGGVAGSYGVSPAARTSRSSPVKRSSPHASYTIEAITPPGAQDVISPGSSISAADCMSTTAAYAQGRDPLMTDVRELEETEGEQCRRLRTHMQHSLLGVFWNIWVTQSASSLPHCIRSRLNNKHSRNASDIHTCTPYVPCCCAFLQPCRPVSKICQLSLFHTQYPVCEQ